MLVCGCVLVLFMLFGLLRVVVLFVRCSVCLCVVSVDQWIRGSVDPWVWDPWIRGSVGPWICGSVDPWVHGSVRNLIRTICPNQVLGDFRAFWDTSGVDHPAEDPAGRL